MTSFEFHTFGSIVDEAAAKMHIDVSTGTFPGADRTSLERDANRARKKFLSKIELSNNIKTIKFNTYADLIVEVEGVVGATTFTTSSAASWPLSGRCIIDGYVIPFTRVGNVFTVDALTFTLEAGSVVRIGYVLPDDFLRPRMVAVNGVEKDVVRKGDSEDVPYNGFVIENNYLYLPIGTVGGYNVTVHYISGSSTLSSTDVLDVADFLDDYILCALQASIHGTMFETEMVVFYEQKMQSIIRDAWDFTQRIQSKRNTYLLPL